MPRPAPGYAMKNWGILYKEPTQRLPIKLVATCEFFAADKYNFLLSVATRAVAHSSCNN